MTQVNEKEIDLDKEYLYIAGEGGIPEVFYTLEGEGEHVGKPSVFLRLSKCNLTCIGFASEDSPNGCDSYISWSVSNKRSFREVFELLQPYVHKLREGAILKLTGGEPLLQQKVLLRFIRAFVNVQYGFIPRIDFETNATIMPDSRWLTEFNATFTTSPKLTTNGDPESKTYKPDVLQFHVELGSGFKFVITDVKDIAEIWTKYVEDINGINIPKNRIWFMPCCGSRQEHIDRATRIAELAKTYNVNFSPRLHLLLWDKALRV